MVYPILSYTNLYFPRYYCKFLCQTSSHREASVKEAPHTTPGDSATIPRLISVSTASRRETNNNQTS